LDQDLQRRTSVYARGAHQVIRHVTEKTDEHPDRQRQCERRVRQDQRPVRVAQMQGADQQKQCADDGDGRKHRHGQDAQQDYSLPANPQLGKRKS
jgi:hypothetical protein